MRLLTNLAANVVAPCLLWVIACGGKALDLDGNSNTPAGAGGTANTAAMGEIVIAKQPQARALALDDTRLYWVTNAGARSCSGRRPRSNPRSIACQSEDVLSAAVAEPR